MEVIILENIEIIVSDQSIPEEDMQAVFQLTKELDERWNKRDSEAFANLFEDDADFRFYTGAWVKGKAAIQAFWNGEVFPGMPEDIRHVIHIKRVRFVSKELVIGDGTLQFVNVIGDQQKIQTEREGTLIAVKKKGCWIITAVRLV
jgi:uncharacterized protein (TIGR02246 family)